MHICFEKTTVITVTQNMTTESNLTLGSQKTLDRFTKERVVELLLILAHKENTENRIADDFVKLGEGQPLMGPDQAV